LAIFDNNNYCRRGVGRSPRLADKKREEQYRALLVSHLSFRPVKQPAGFLLIQLA
jgi:hypothetical protein